MKWIVAAIIVCVVPYTLINIKYRKSAPANLPYQDTKDRAGVIRLLGAGFQRISLEILRPGDPQTFAVNGVPATTTSVPGGLPPVLSEALIDKPLVPSAIAGALAPSQASAANAYTFQFTGTQPQLGEQLAHAEAYVHSGRITIAPAFEPLEGDLRSRSLETTAQLTIPAGALKPGTYEITLIGARNSLRWSLEVR